MPQVEEWLQELRSFIHDVLELSASNPDESPSLEPLYLLEYSLDLMLDDAFRKRYLALLGRFPKAAGRFMASDSESGRPFVQELGVIAIIPPVTDPNRKGPLPTPRFSRPIIHHRSRTDRDPAKTDPDNIRLLLDHIWFLGWHPQYLLVCTKCGWVQGSLATAQAYASKVPHPCIQVQTWWSRQEWAIRRDARAEGLVRSFREEIWGRDVLNAPVERRDGLKRGPGSGEIAETLDVLMGLHHYPDDWPEPLRMHNERDRRERLIFLARMLREIKCQICEAVGKLRYMPRLLLPIDADLSAASQARQVLELSELLDRARIALAKRPAARRVLWIPKRLPPMKLDDLSQRFELRHEALAKARGAREPNTWLLAMWLIDISSASGRGKNGERRGGRRSKGARVIWHVLFDELGVARTEPSNATDQEFHDLKQAVDALLAKKRKHQALIYPTRALLESGRFDQAVGMLADFYSEKFLPTKLDDLARTLK